jgi:hypothetical protein
VPAAAVAVLLFKLTEWHGDFEPIATFVSLLVSLAGFFIEMIIFDIKFGSVEDVFDMIDIIVICAVFGILFVSTAISALTARRLSRIFAQ